MRLAAALAFCLVFARDARAQEERRAPSGLADAAPRDLLLPDANLIDLPTAEVLDYGGYSSRARFFAGGGFVDWMGFGVYPRVNLGASLYIDKLIGNDDPVRLTRPELQLKFRFFDGDRYIPAFAVGFDGQGWLYNRPAKRYNHKQRGVYVVGSQEIGLPGLQGHAGVNISDFESNSVFGTLGLSLAVREKVKLMAEWDAINNFFDSRVNTGARIYVTPNFSFDFAVRALGHGGKFSNGTPRKPERTVQFKYVGNF